MNLVKEIIQTSKAKRIEQGMSIRTLAKITGVSFSTLSRLERGIGAPDAKTTARLFSWIECEPNDLGTFVLARENEKNTNGKSIKVLKDLISVINRKIKSLEIGE